MKWLNKPVKQSISPIYQQIKNGILNAIEERKLQIGDSIPSINKICNEFELAPGTVIRAYDELREMGIISSKQGKGYFVAGIYIEQKTKIFLLFDRINAFKEILYDSFRNEFDEETDIQVFFHHYDSKRFEKLVRENLGKFSHYILMPHLHENIQRVVQRIPEKRLIFIDNLPTNLHTNAHAVYQNFYNDIYNALEDRITEIAKYKSINLSLSKSDFQFVPQETQKGFVSFCETHQFQHKIIQNITESNISKNDLYIIFDDSELLNTLKIIQNKQGYFGVKHRFRTHGKNGCRFGKRKNERSDCKSVQADLQEFVLKAPSGSTAGGEKRRTERKNSMKLISFSI